MSDNIDTMVQVKVIRRIDDDATLVEWQGEKYPCRGYISWSLVNDNMVNLSDLDTAEPYGICWQDHIDLASLTHVLVSALYKNDLWTLEDLRQKDRRLNRIAVKTVGSHVWDIAKNEES